MNQINNIHAEIILDVFVVMPNHFHAIVFINDVGANGRSPLREIRKNMGSKTLSSLIAGFKSTVTKQINQIRHMPGVPVWQRNYYEHVIRNEGSMAHIREYIATNPLQWILDRENPESKQVAAVEPREV